MQHTAKGPTVTDWDCGRGMGTNWNKHYTV